MTFLLKTTRGTLQYKKAHSAGFKAIAMFARQWFQLNKSHFRLKITVISQNIEEITFCLLSRPGNPRTKDTLGFPGWETQNSQDPRVKKNRPKFSGSEKNVILGSRECKSNSINVRFWPQGKCFHPTKSGNRRKEMLLSEVAVNMIYGERELLQSSVQPLASYQVLTDQHCLLLNLRQFVLCTKPSPDIIIQNCLQRHLKSLTTFLELPYLIPNKCFLHNVCQGLRRYPSTLDTRAEFLSHKLGLNSNTDKLIMQFCPNNASKEINLEFFLPNFPQLTQNCDWRWHSVWVGKLTGVSSSSQIIKALTRTILVPSQRRCFQRCSERWWDEVYSLFVLNQS